MTKHKVEQDGLPREGEMYRHVKRGNSYTVMGPATLQTSTVLNDNDTLVIYRGENGELWARPIGEFCDGRFERMLRPRGGS
jgi:hypothetical protein